MKLNMGGNNLYVWVGSFALILMAWLWVGPKLIRKPAGTPPRSGSNEEVKEVVRLEQGMLPQPTGGPSRIPGVFQSPSTIGAIGSSGLIPTGGGGGLRNIGVSPTDILAQQNIYQAPRLANAAVMMPRAGGLFPFNKVIVS